MIYAFKLIEKGLQMYTYTFIAKCKENNKKNVPALKLIQKPTKHGESVKTCIFISLLQH